MHIHQSIGELHNHHSADSNKRTTSWSVELSQVTTLAPPGKLLVERATKQVANHNNNYQPQQQSQEILFDDTREPMHLTYAPKLDNQLEAAHFYNNQQFKTTPLIHNQSNSWIPTMKTTGMPSEPTHRLVNSYQYLPAESQLLPQPLAKSIEASFDHFNQQSKQPNYMTWLNLNKYLNHNDPTGSYPSNMVVSRDLLDRALSIQDKLLSDQIVAEQQRLSSWRATKKVTKPAKQLTTNNKSRENNSYGFMNYLSKPSSNLKRSTKQRDEPLVDEVASSMRISEHLAAASDSLRDGILYYTAQPVLRAPIIDHGEAEQASHLLNEPRTVGEKIRHAPDAMLPAASHHHHSLTPLIYSYHGHPYMAHHKQVSTRSEKALLTPVLIGVAAALISFLIISNLFLTLPLFAMTLWQLLNGSGMMMMPNGNGNNNNNMPMTPPNQNNNAQNSIGRKRRRRDLTSYDDGADLSVAMILKGLERLAEKFESQ